ncbi:MAG: hypothetical protein U0694_02140 [Anaerolineae bacterium]
MYKRIFMALTILLLALSASASLAQDAPAEPVFAGVNAMGDLVIFGSDGIITVTNPSNRGLNSLVWSDDGTLLAYLMYDENYQSRVMVTDGSGQTPQMLETGALEGGFPITFTPDGNILYVQQGVFPSDASAPYQSQLMQIAPTVGAQPSVVGTITYSVGCGGGSPYPADWQYTSASGGFGGSFLVLEWTDYGILYSVNCAGFGLALFDPNTGEARALTPDAFSALSDPAPQSVYGRARLSADGSAVVGIRSQLGQDLLFTLYTADLATGTITDIPSSHMPEQAGWGPDGSVVYMTREQVSNLTANLTAEQSAALEQVFGGPMDVPAYQTSIYQVNVATGEETQLYSEYAYAVGRMTLTNDGRGLLFTTIPNMDAWVAGLVDGSLDVLNDMDGSAQRATVAVNLFLLPLNTGEPAGFVSMIEQFALRPTSS